MYQYVKYKKIVELRDEWQMIYKSNPLLSPYQSYEYCSIVTKDYRFTGRRIMLTPYFFLIMKDGKPRMIVPLWKKPSLKGTKWYLLPDLCAGAGYLDFVYYPDCSNEDFENAFKLIRKEIGEGNLMLRRVNERSLMGKYVESFHGSQDSAGCVRIRFEEGYDKYYASLSKNTRQNIRTAYNRMSKAGIACELKVVSGQFFDDELWNEVLRIHKKRYLLRDGIKENPIRNYIHRKHDPTEIALRNHKDNIVFLLKIDNTFSAYFVGFISNDRKEVVVPRLSIDDDAKFYSPGVIMIAEAVKYLSENTDIRAIDLCHGEQSYKYTMGGAEHTNYYYYDV